ncbi:MAG: phosphopyruvate hydratase [Candidatus Sungbacteria bacterium]|uniref:Enolase n=1 Tax=Candidatus Sungiibacteriota bacterium TaxID=2750080 RepID=A0A931YDM1_9BACT|nr:phosphopyruvate hydratase [Candidatus Sungbacteria bacterium]MBI2466010.1 phosphopyruvate hydratase [Candidatus Sungbacteria bacterium]
MSKITQIRAREILDSRGNPTLEVTAASEDVSASFSVPSGASIGSHEALEKRDGDKKRFRGLGVLGTVKTIDEIVSPALTGLDPANQKKIDAALLQLDGTANKTNLGGNTIIGVSIACAKLAARTQKKEVFEHLRSLADIKPSRSTPLLYMNLVNGGKHAQSQLAFQEYHVVPLTDDVETALDWGTKIQHELKEKIVESLGATSANYGDEGGFVPSAAEIKKPLELLLQILEEHKLSDKVKLALDVAASSFYNQGQYEFNGQNHSADEFLDFYGTLINSFPILSIEDPFYEEDFKRFAQLLLYKQVKVVGDDLTVTNPARLKEAITQKSIDTIIIKPNQIGTLTETLETMRLARANNIECIVSHRSGETSDDFIADLAFAFGAFGLKAGAPHGGERVVKYNRLLEITKIIS